MKYIKKIVLVVVPLIALIGGTRFATKGFTKHNIYRVSDDTFQHTATGPVDPSHFENAFHFLGSGTQVFALCSDDGSTVIKLFRNDRSTHPLKWSMDLIPSSLKKRLQRTLLKRKRRFEKSLGSCLIAYEYLKEETGLLEVVLSPNRDAPTLTYTDAIGVCHYLELSGRPYLVQKRATPFYSTLEKWIAGGDLEPIKDSLRELITLIETRCKKGIADKDPDMRTNFGWLDTHPIQTDVGRFSFDSSRSDPAVYRLELIRHTDRLCIWLDTHCPQLAEWMRAEVRSR